MNAGVVTDETETMEYFKVQAMPHMPILGKYSTRKKNYVDFREREQALLWIFSRERYESIAWL